MKMGSVQGLRAVAALLVVCDHVPRLEAKIFPHGLMHGFGAAGAIGVDLFFVISGFIMITTTWTSFGKPKAPSAFLARRFLRIYPAYWAALVPFLAIGIAVPTALALAPLTVASVVSSFLLVPQNDGPLMFVAWSLEFELYFYLVFAAALRFPNSRIPLALGIWIAATLILNAVAHASDTLIVDFLGSPLPFEFIGGGLVGYLLLHKIVIAPRVALVLGIVLATIVAIYSSRFDGFGSLDLAWFRVLTAGPAMMLVVYGAVALEEGLSVEPPRFAIALGDASYTIYLWHGMLLGAYGVAVAHLHLHGRLGDAIYLIGAFAVVILGSLVIFRIVERPLTTGAKRLFRVGGNPAHLAIPASTSS